MRGLQRATPKVKAIYQVQVTITLRNVTIDSLGHHQQREEEDEVGNEQGQDENTRRI